MAIQHGRTQPRRRLRGLSTGGVLVALVALSAVGSCRVEDRPADVASVPDAPSGWIVFAGGLAADPENYRLWVVDLAGGEPRALSDAGPQHLSRDTWEAAPALSPDGTRVAFLRSRGDGNEIVVIADIDGWDERSLIVGTPLAEGYAHDIVWSPDGSQIALSMLGWDTAASEGRLDLFVVDADSTNLRDLTVRTGDDVFPSWSPDGSRLALTHWLHGPAGENDVTWIDVVALDSSGIVRVVDDPRERVVRAGWTTDAARIVYAGHGAAPGIYSVAPDGSDRRRLAGDRVLDGALAWSPDGRQLAWLATRDGASDVVVADAEGRERRVVCALPGGEASLPAWSPDGRWLLVLTRPLDARPDAAGSARYDLLVVDVGGGTVRIVVEDVTMRFTRSSPPRWWREGDR